MKIKLFLSLALSTVLIAGVTTSCSDDNPGGGPEVVDPDDDDPEYEGPIAEHNITFSHLTYVSPAVDSEISESLGHILTNRSMTLDNSVRLAVLDNLSELSEPLIDELYDSKTIIAVVNPDYSEIASFFAAHPEWNSTFKPEYYSADDYVYYFNALQNSGTVSTGTYDVVIEEEGDDYDDEDTIVVDNAADDSDAEESKYNKYYYTLGTWLEHLDNHIMNNDDFEEDYAQSQLPVLENLLTTTHCSKTFDIKLSDVVRKDAKITGTASVTISYDVYQLHAYEGDEGAGNYYIVNSLFSINNADMYAGKNKKVYNGLHVRTIGYICKSAGYNTDFISEADEREVNLIIPASYGTVPQSTSGATKFTSSKEFSLGANAGWSKEKGPAAGINFGAKWGSSEERTIKDVEISNRTVGSKPGWTLIFENLPYYSDEVKFKERENVKAFKENQQLASQWVWYDADAVDDVEDFGHFFLFNGEIVYEAMSFISTRADLKTKTYTIKLSSQVYPVVPPVYNKRKGAIVLENDTQDFIRNIRVNDKISGTEVYFDPSSHPGGSKIELGWYQIKDNQYTVSFECGDQTYILDRDSVTLKHLQTVSLYASYDFNRLSAQ